MVAMFSRIAPFLLVSMATLPGMSRAGFGSGPGTDPFGFGNVTESCKLPPFVSQNFVLDWNNFSRLHYVMMSKEHATRISQRLFRDANLSHITKADLTSACISLDQLPSVDGRHNYRGQGYGSQSMELTNYALGIPGLMRFDRSDFVGDMGGISQLSISNNKDFNLGVICWDDGVGTWIVNSPQRSLSSRNKYLVEQHLKALGFNSDHFFTFNWSHCPPDKKEEDEEQ